MLCLCVQVCEWTQAMTTHYEAYRMKKIVYIHIKDQWDCLTLCIASNQHSPRSVCSWTHTTHATVLNVSEMSYFSRIGDRAPFTFQYWLHPTTKTFIKAVTLCDSNSVVFQLLTSQLRRVYIVTEDTDKAQQCWQEINTTGQEEHVTKTEITALDPPTVYIIVRRSQTGEDVRTDIACRNPALNLCIFSVLVWVDFVPLVPV